MPSRSRSSSCASDEQVPGAGEDHELAVTDERLHHRARVRRQDLVPVAVEQEQGSRPERGTVLAPGGLGRERDHPRAVLTEDDAELQRDGAAERVTDRHEPLRARAGREVRSGGQVEHAAGEVVRLAVADADRADALGREPLAEVVVEAARGSEEPAHPAAAHDHDLLGLGIAVPEQREQPLERVDLEVVEVGRDLHVLGRQRLEQLERRTGRRCSQQRAEQLPGAALLVVAGAELGGDEVGDARVGEPPDLGAHRRLVADDREVLGPGRALRGRASPGTTGSMPYTWKTFAARPCARVHVARDAHRHAGADPRARPAGRGRRLRDRRHRVATRACSAPVIQVTVPSATVPASSSIFGPSAATSTGHGVAPGTSIELSALIVSPVNDGSRSGSAA